MRFAYTQEEADFRGEVRDWLRANVPKSPLPSFDTAEGFATHREWERRLSQGNYGMVTWPEAQKARYLPRIARGDEIWAQAWSEPNAGSDMAAIRTKATRTASGFVINGQKIWSSRAVSPSA